MKLEDVELHCDDAQNDDVLFSENEKLSGSMNSRNMQDNVLPNLMGGCRSPSLVNSTNQMQNSMDIQFRDLKHLIDKPHCKNDLTKSAPYFKKPSNNLSMIQIINDQEKHDLLGEESKSMKQEESFEV